MAQKKEQICRRIMWFEKRIKYNIDFFEYLQPQRIVSEHPRYRSGVFYSEKCKRLIQYESNLELDFIKRLEQMESVVFYYEQPVRIPYRRGKRKQEYTPDFFVLLHTGEIVLVEIKDLQGMLEDRVQLKIEALLGFCSQRGFGLLLTDGRHTIDELLKIRNNRLLEKEILRALDCNVLRKRQCDEIMKKCNSTHNQLLKVIIRNNLKFKSYPFKLQRNNKNKIFRKVFYEKKSFDELVEEKYPTLFK